MQGLSINQSKTRFIQYTRSMQRGRKALKEAPLFGKRLSYFRSQKGLTQQELAEAVEVSRDLIGHYERRCENPSLEFIRKAAEALDVTADELIGIRPQSPKKSGPSPRAIQLVNKMADLSKPKQQVILDMLESYLTTAQAGKR
jgi:transcriptional regulator with XRE-family HTH domain